MPRHPAEKLSVGSQERFMERRHCEEINKLGNVPDFSEYSLNPSEAIRTTVKPNNEHTHQGSNILDELFRVHFTGATENVGPLEEQTSPNGKPSGEVWRLTGKIINNLLF